MAHKSECIYIFLYLKCSAALNRGFFILFFEAGKLNRGFNAYIVFICFCFLAWSSEWLGRHHRWYNYCIWEAVQAKKCVQYIILLKWFRSYKPRWGKAANVILSPGISYSSLWQLNLHTSKFDRTMGVWSMHNFQGKVKNGMPFQLTRLHELR